MQDKLGLIGLGAMGRPMALNLLRAGYSVAVYARRPATLDALIAAGANACATPAEVGAASDIVITMVMSAADVEQVVLGDNGVMHGMRAGTVVVDMETISPLAARRIAQALAQRQIDMLDAPVSGGAIGAERATLSIMAGGPLAVFERVRPVFESLGKTVRHMGEHGAGQATKACNQLALTVTLQGVAEALTLARSYGVDPAKVCEVMSGGVAASRVLELFGKRMVERDFANGIDAHFYYKDLHIVLDLAHELGVALPACALVMQSFNALIARPGGATRDSSWLIEVLEGMCGVQN